MEDGNVKRVEAHLQKSQRNLKALLFRDEDKDTEYKVSFMQVVFINTYVYFVNIIRFLACASYE